MSAIGRASVQDLKELTISFLLMNSLLSNVFAEQIRMASDSEIEKFRKDMLNGYILMSYLTLSQNSMGLLSKYFKQFITNIENQESNEKEEYALILLSFPFETV